MKNSSSKNKMNSKKRKKFNMFTLVAILFVAYFIYTFFDQQIQINKYNSQIEMYTADINSKKKETEYYKTQKSNINSTEYIESVARNSLGYVKPYEKIFVDTNK